jgi:hypothetical protein
MRPVGACLVLSLLLGACGTYRSRVGPMRDFAGRGELDRSLEHVASVLSPGDLLYNLESGLLLHLLGRYEESDGALDAAERLIEDLYTESLTRKGLTFLLNDAIEPYSGERHERLLIHYYRALNHIHMGDPEGAVVESRKLSLLLAEGAAEPAPSSSVAAMSHYLAGLWFGAGHRLNDAVVSYRLARALYEGEPAAGIGEPPWLASDLLDAAKRGGFAGLAADMEGRGVEGASDPEKAQLVFLFENGWVPAKQPTHIDVPILATERTLRSEGVPRLAGSLEDRYERHRRTGAWFTEEVKIDYWLRVALPELPDAPPEAAASARISAGGRSATTCFLADVERDARRAFDDDAGRIFLKAAARALLKYLVHEAAEKEGGEVAGFLANLAGVATEVADTRSWAMLPREIQMARLALEPGRHDLDLEILSGDGVVLDRIALGPLDAAPGEVLFVNWRRLPGPR